jgi:transposase
MRMVKLSPQRGETLTSLLHRRVTATHPRLCERLVALALVAAGRPSKVVAPWLGRNRGTVEAWVRRFNAQGLEGLRPTCRGYRGTLLSAQELAQLKRTVQRPPRQAGLKTGTWTGKVVRAFVQRHFGPTISDATARRSLPRLGFRRKRPRQRYVKADPEAQRALAQALQHLEQHREPGRVTADMDQGQIWPDALPRLGWFLRGHPALVDSTSPPKRDKLLFSVAVVRPLGRVITMLCAWFTQETTATCLAKRRRCLRHWRIDLVLDHARHHQGTMVEEALAHDHIEPPRLPPDSPELNAAEPWIGWAKADLSANTCWQDHGSLVRAFIGFVASMTKRPEKVLQRCVPKMLGSNCV